MVSLGPMHSEAQHPEVSKLLPRSMRWERHLERKAPSGIIAP